MTESDNEEENAQSLHKLLRCCRAPQIRTNNVLLLEQAFESLHACIPIVLREEGTVNWTNRSSSC
jgi:hypothetical protein